MSLVIGDERSDGAVCRTRAILFAADCYYEFAREQTRGLMCCISMVVLGCRVSTNEADDVGQLSHT